MNCRTEKILKNIVTSFIIKGWSAVVLMLMVPLTLSCLGEYRNGVWLTISSVLVWIDLMDIGLGNGLRNSLAYHLAKGETKLARKAVSSTVAMLCAIMLPVMLILCAITYCTDIFSFFNTDSSLIPDLRISLLISIILVSMTFVLKFIGNFYMGLQLPAVSNFIIVSGQTLALLLTWILKETDNVDFINIAFVNVISPLIVYFIAYPYTFIYKYPELSPSLKLIDVKAMKQLSNVGVKFFWLQIAGIIQFMSANILISNLFSPAMVTPYHISYRYLSISLVVFSVICMPFWNATTDAYARKDIEWIRKANTRMNFLMLIIAAGLVLLVLISHFVYKIWIGTNCHIPQSMTIMMAIYIFLMILSTRYSYFLNGIGALKLQIYMTVMSVLFIPIAWVVGTSTHNITYFLGVMSFCIAPSILVNMIQFNKIINGKAIGIWKI